MNKSNAWLRMMRMSNAPTIVSNITVGAALAYQVNQDSYGVRHFIFILIAVFLVYFAGMILNDAWDANRDLVDRPKRPIPQGLISKTQAWLVGFSMLGIAIAIGIIPLHHTVATYSIPLLIIVMLTYTFLHRWMIPAILLMGICRGLIYIVVCLMFWVTNLPTQLIPFSISLAMYTAVLTYIGRSETNKKTKHAFVTWFLMIPPLYFAITQWDSFGIAWIPFLAMASWVFLAWRNFLPTQNKPIQGMHRLLSGFCLLDCVFLASIDEFNIMFISVGCFFLTVVLHRKILGT